MFSATITERTPETVIHLEGDLDIAATPHLVGVVQGAMNAGYRRISLDLEDVSFVDSTGLACVARLTRRASELDIDLVLRHPNDLAARVLEVTGLDTVIDIRTG
ncbi:MAG: STAS domain-containing protein [Acidimicrobiales bacterium]